MRVLVVYAEPDRADVRAVDLADGACVRDALDATGRLEQFESHGWRAGVFGRRVALDAALADGDRVEILRPLQVDPKEARRLRGARRGQPAQ